MNFSEKTCLITGANNGLGFAVSKKLAEQGVSQMFFIILRCRSPRVN